MKTWALSLEKRPLSNKLTFHMLVLCFWDMRQFSAKPSFHHFYKEDHAAKFSRGCKEMPSVQHGAWHNVKCPKLSRVLSCSIY